MSLPPTLQEYKVKDDNKKIFPEMEKPFAFFLCQVVWDEENSIPHHNSHSSIQMRKEWGNRSLDSIMKRFLRTRANMTC